MSKADEYLGYARQCQQLADETQSPADKERWHKLAQSWLSQIAEPRDDQPVGGKTSDRRQNR